MCILCRHGTLGTDRLETMRTAGNSAAGAYRQGISGGPLGKLRCLQRLLTCSFSGKALAVKRVTENKGKRTSGVDHVIWSTPQSKLKATASLQRRGYRPLPLRRVYIPKSNGKLRPLSIPAMKDRAMQALYPMAPEAVAETCAERLFGLLR